MNSTDPSMVTRLLDAISAGDDDARTELWTTVYDELRQIASQVMARSPADHTLQPTVLVNEAYLRILGGAALARHNHEYFFGAMAKAMRRILYEYDLTRNRRRAYREPAQFLRDVPIPEDSSTPDERLIAQSEALDDLAEHNNKVYDAVMFQWFCGLGVENTAELMGVSTRTVKRYTHIARAWLQHEIHRRLNDGGPEISVKPSRRSRPNNE